MSVRFGPPDQVLTMSMPEDSPIIKEVAILVDEAKRKEKERNKDKPPSNRDYSVIEAGKKLKQLAIDNKTKIDNWINNLKNDRRRGL
ncbi:hypothetical protein DdX_22061 [Ditylenchus destructor]|uniref:Uncharacterized protein n=1 Tax=Ditylenchus destructor TaxID=166010 RepID=A0AAD4ME43_9BILA|nr:hypothetical protein DdX_22061 [Ditylenchus destructor]